MIKEGGIYLNDKNGKYFVFLESKDIFWFGIMFTPYIGANNNADINNGVKLLLDTHQFLNFCRVNKTLSNFERNGYLGKIEDTLFVKCKDLLKESPLYRGLS